MGRVRNGVTHEQTLAELQPLFSETVRESWAARPPKSDKKGTSFPDLRLAPGSQGFEGPRRDALPLLASSLAVAAAVLLIGCVNVGNLVLARTLSRRQELAVRMALGASRGRVVRQMLTEDLVMALMGAAAGTLAAFWGRGFLSWLPSSNASVVDASLGLPEIACAVTLAIVATTLLGIGPALRAARSTLSPHTHTFPRTRSVGRRSLVVLQVSVTLVLLVAGSLLLETLYNVSRIDPGFDSSNLLVFRINPNTQGEDSARTFQRLDVFQGAIRDVPGVRSATMSTMPMLAQAEWSASVADESGGEPRSAYIQGVGPAFFETMGIRLITGRPLTAADREGAVQVAVINESMARQVFNMTDPVGRRFRFVEGSDRDVPIEVVGVVRDVAYARVQDPPPPTLYRPYRQLPAGTMTFEVKTAADPLNIVSAVRAKVRQVDPAASVSGMKTLAQQIQETIALPRALALVTTGCALVGLGLACIGLYGLVSFDVLRKTREIGIRMALGASQQDVVRLVVRETVGVVLVGATLGLAAAMPAAIAARRLLYGVSLANPAAVVAAVSLLGLAASLAAYLPAKRACAVDPTTALRAD
jgi:predicted permease